MVVAVKKSFWNHFFRKPHLDRNCAKDFSRSMFAPRAPHALPHNLQSFHHTRTRGAETYQGPLFSRVKDFSYTWPAKGNCHKLHRFTRSCPRNHITTASTLFSPAYGCACLTKTFILILGPSSQSSLMGRAFTDKRPAPINRVTSPSIEKLRASTVVRYP